MLKISKQELCDKLSVVKAVINERTEVESARGALIANGRITGTNLTTFISSEINCDESFIVPARAIRMIELLPDGDVTIIVENEGSLIIKSRAVSSRFSTYPVRDFPEIPNADSAKAVEVPGEEFVSAINGVIYLAKKDAANRVYSGVLLDGKGGVLNAVASDGTRMASYELPSNAAVNCIVPRDAAALAIANIKSGGVVQICSTAKHVQIEHDGIRIISRLLSGTFIDYQKIFGTHGQSVTVSRGGLHSCVSRGTVCVDEKSLPVAKIEIADGELAVTASNPESSFSEALSLLEYDDNDAACSFGINILKLLEIIKKQTAENLKVEFSSATSPVIITGGRLRTIILPIKLRGNA